MTTNLYLAMTAAEISAVSPLPTGVAWMACHFSPYSTGLSNVPQALPEGSLLILNDITPIHGHDPGVIAGQLEACLTSLRCRGLLLDFQRAPSGETDTLVKQLIQALPCPVAVSEPFAQDLSCPVFLPPCPPHVRLNEYLAPWKGRELWLEAALDGETITLTQEGALFEASTAPPGTAGCFQDEALYCHYDIETDEKTARFALQRTGTDLIQLMQKAQTLGVTTFVGLYQELSGVFPGTPET